MRSPDRSIGREYIFLHSDEREALAARAAPCPLWGFLAGFQEAPLGTFLNAYGYISRTWRDILLADLN